MPFAFRIEEFSSVVGDVRAFLHAHGERFLVRFQDLHLKVVVKLLVLVLPSVRAHQVLVKADSSLVLAVLLLNLDTCSLQRQCAFFPDWP